MSSTAHSTFAALIGPHVDALFRAAYRLTCNRPDAEDLVQEVCLRAYGKLAELERLDHPKGWLLKVQYRLFVDGARRRHRSPLRAIGSDEESAATPSGDPGPDELVDGIIEAERMQAAWNALEKQQRALLALQAEGYSLAEMQAITELSTDVLKARLYRARVRFGKLLGIRESGSVLLPRS
ncbi:MAG TPA: RNA polymerase sigma factor [Gammaproteobacteria bacterium]|nr:RNA polymerase sigma factor [Gammaproteobacteria bacterium]